MCYHVLTQRGIVISHATVHRVTNIKKMTADVRYTFQNFDEAMQPRIKSCSEDGYIGDKPNPDHREDLIDYDSNFHKEFERIYNSDEIPEADDEEYTPDVLDDTYLNMELYLPRDGKVPEIARIVQRLRDKYSISIVTANDNLIVDS